MAPRPVTAFRNRLVHGTLVLRDQLRAVVDRERARESLLELRHRQPRRRVVAADPLANQPAEEAAHGRELPSHRRLAPAPVETREPGPHVIRIDLRRPHSGAGVDRQLAHVGFVRAARIRREPSLDTEVTPEAVDCLAPVHATSSVPADTFDANSAR